MLKSLRWLTRSSALQHRVGVAESHCDHLHIAFQVVGNLLRLFVRRCFLQIETEQSVV